MGGQRTHPFAGHWLHFWNKTMHHDTNESSTMLYEVIRSWRGFGLMSSTKLRRIMRIIWDTFHGLLGCRVQVRNPLEREPLRRGGGRISSLPCAESGFKPLLKWFQSRMHNPQGWWFRRTHHLSAYIYSETMCSSPSGERPKIGHKKTLHGS